MKEKYEEALCREQKTIKLLVIAINGTEIGETE